MLIIIILATAFSVNASAQSDTVKYVYAELVGTQRFLSTKVTVQIDFGQATKWTTDNRVRDEVTGKLKLFSTQWLMRSTTWVRMDGSLCKRMRSLKGARTCTIGY
jgi:hypothetical protein